MITRSELVAKLREVRGATIVSIFTATDPISSGMRKTGNPFVRGRGAEANSTLRKVGKANGMLNSQYDAAVERRLTKDINETRAAENLPPLEGEALQAEIDSRFRRGESWWQPIMAADGKVTPLAANKKTPEDAAYLTFVVRSEGGGELVGVEDGKAVDSELIADFMPEQRKYENQGLSEEDKVRIRCYKIENVMQIMIGGERYIISDNVQQYVEPTRRTLYAICEEYMEGERTMHAVGV